ncbi:protein of unknown function [Kyrpidia spormannii]|uniref:Transposase IS116/IS110/IS902 C-terminal domain-containing protein n=1 Tax=Kyrpidia spormannii TaxID=2055160 RepID=A0A6F9E3J3_9BACL|nr:protein of unknown function [Kyrpidia spormannii]
MRPFEEDLELLETIPGVGRLTAEQVLAEIGTDMDQFPSAAHLCSWAGLAPGNNESAGKRKSGKTRKGNQKLRAALMEAARAAARTKDTYLAAPYHRIAARRGSNRAAVAVAHSILTIVSHMLRRRQPYKELGPTYYDSLEGEVSEFRHEPGSVPSALWMGGGSGPGKFQRVRGSFFFGKRRRCLHSLTSFHLRGNVE